MRLPRILCLLLFTFFVSASVANAQAQAPVPIPVPEPAPAHTFNVFGGFNQSYYATVEGGEAKAKQGYNVGAFALLRKDKGLKIQPEIQFSQRRVNVVYSRIDTTYDVQYFNMG